MGSSSCGDNQHGWKFLRSVESLNVIPTDTEGQLRTSASLDFDILGVLGSWNQTPMDTEGWLYTVLSPVLAFSYTFQCHLLNSYSSGDYSMNLEIITVYFQIIILHEPCENLQHYNFIISPAIWLWCALLWFSLYFFTVWFVEVLYL